MSSLRNCVMLAAVFGVLGVDSVARAAVVAAVDIGTASSPVYSGTFTSPTDGSTASFVGGVFPNSGTYATPSSFSIATASSGTLTFTVSNYDSNFARGATDNTAGAYQAIYEDGEITTINGTFTISGLQPNTSYGVVIQSFEPALDSQTSSFTPATVGVVNPPGQSTVDDSANNNSPANYLYNDPDYPNAGNVAFYGADALTSDVSGNIVFNLGGSGGYTRINGIEIFSAVPEPSSLGLLLVGGMGLFRRRRASV